MITGLVFLIVSIIPAILDNFNNSSNYFDVLFELCHEIRICVATFTCFCNNFGIAQQLLQLLLKLLFLLL